jgi:beta-glucanase (GH16 family)
LTLDVTDITPEQLLNGYTLNLTAQGVCSSTAPTDCIVSSNATTNTIINPVRSARLTTQGKHAITYGRVEVVAKLPRGDWLWPAIWMLPAESVYGEWPESGEIDLVESRGNSGLNYTADGGGRNTVISTLHWGLNFLTDMFEQTTWADTLRRGDYSDSFHTFGLEWSEDYMYVYVDNRLATSVYVKFGPQLGTMWQRGRFEELGYLE